MSTIKYHIGRKVCRYFPRDPDAHIFNENTTHWLTYFNPNSKLHVKYAHNIACTGVQSYDTYESARNVFDSMQRDGQRDLILVKVQYAPDGIEKFEILAELAYMIEFDGEGGSGCDTEFDVHIDAEWHMRNYTEKERRHLYVAEYVKKAACVSP